MIQQNDTPEWMDRLINQLAPEDVADEICGDLYELYVRDIADSGRARARRNYIKNGFGFLLKRFFWKNQTIKHHNNLNMISSYFTMARRSLMAYKSNTTINILGLVIGIASALVIFTTVHFEMSFDTFHSNADRIYRVVRVSGDNMDEFRSGVSWPVPVAMKEEISTLKDITAVEYFGGGEVEVLDSKGTSIRRFQEGQGLVLTGPSFFKIFDFAGTSFRWIEGNPATALREPNSMVLTRALAKKYFGDDQALGKVVKIEKQVDCKITGIIEDLPSNSDFPFKGLISYNTIHKSGNREMHDWEAVGDAHHVYIVINQGTTQQEMERQIAKVHAAHTPKELHENRHYLLQPLSKLHREAKFGNFSGRTISNETILSLTLIGIFLLLTASINYVNLATAQSTMRAKEIGLRKVMGSNRNNLIGQFITETFVVVFISGILGLLLAEFLLLKFQSLLNVPWLSFHFMDPFTLKILSFIVVTVTILAGLYPSINISRFNPVTALKNKFGTEKVSGFSLRKILVVFQFTVTQVLVVGTFIIVSQMRFFNDRDMGFNKEGIITTTIPGNDPSKLKVLADQLRSQSYVSGVSYSFTLPSGASRNRNYNGIGRENATESKDFIVFEYASIDSAYFGIYKIKLLAGRNLVPTDTLGNLIVNKTLAKALQLGTPEQSLNSKVKLNGKLYTIVGVTDDYYSNSLKEGVDKIGMVLDPNAYYFLSIKLNTREQNAAMPDAVAGIEKIWSSTFPESIFSYQYFDQNIKAFYEQEEKYAAMFQIFSFVFLAIGCLGLYGLITFVVNRKSKEIAIRKVLGATISQILVMFSKEYLQLILLSFLIAIPITWYAVDKWLSNFAERIPLQWWLFVAPGFIVLTVALLVVVSKSLRTANLNPVDKLKYE
ncbi:MAG: ABC transporter permease [Chryseolinea sp.]